MKTIVLSFAASLEHRPANPERTAKRALRSFDVQFQTWPNRASMAKSIRMQQRDVARRVPIIGAHAFRCLIAKGIKGARVLIQLRGRP